jgi:hypothetical protein
MGNCCVKDHEFQCDDVKLVDRERDKVKMVIVCEESDLEGSVPSTMHYDFSIAKKTFTHTFIAMTTMESIENGRD